MRFQILTDEGIVECEAESIYQAASSYEEANEDKNYEVFHEGECPDLLTLEDYQEIYSIFGNHTACAVFNRIAKRILLEYIEQEKE